MHRFFVPPAAVDGRTVRFPSGPSHQIMHVLRMRVGDCVVVLDNSGDEYIVELIAFKASNRRHPCVEGYVVERRRNGVEPQTSLHLYQGLLKKGTTFEFVLQKCTEIGVKTFTPLQAERAVAGIPNERRRERYAEVVREAAEQSGRGQLPAIMPTLSLTQAVGQVRGLGLFLWEEAPAHHSLNTVLRDHAGTEITLFIGPEGGFSQREAQLAAQAGLHIITLGPRVLRAETAAIVASALVLGTLGELG